MLACALGLCSLSATAQEPAAADDNANAWAKLGDRYYLSPSLSWVFADSGRETDDGQALSLAIGRRWSDVFALEAFAQYNRFDHEQGSDSADLIGLGVNSLFFPTSKVPAYLLLGAGYGDVQSHPGGDESYGALLLNLGGGYWCPPFDLLFKGMALRTEAVYRLDAHNDRRTGSTVDNGRKAFGDVLLSVGLNIPIGSVPTPPPPPEPEPVEVVAVVPPPDSDGDGVTDDLDQCPGTPAGTVVDASGCPVVPPCKAPEPGEKLDLSGCGTGDVIVLKGVNFEFNQSRLTANARTIMQGVAEALQAAPTTNVELGGHTDALGSDDYNQRLSERRACTVARHLVGQGIESGRLTPAGYGEAQPIADNQTDEGRELNRRVELKLLEGSGTGLSDCAAAPALGAASAAAVEASPTDDPAGMIEPAIAEPESLVEEARTSEPANQNAEPEPQPNPLTEAEAEAEPTAESVTPVPAAASATSSAPSPPAAAAMEAPLEVVPASEVFGADDAAANAVSDPAPSGEVQQVPESEVFGSLPAAEPRAAASNEVPPPASGVQQVPESEVFGSGN
jgi:OOP family OmpA-OmpF porin